MNYLVSIICPIYNEERFIVKCVESILQQNYPHDSLEIYFVDVVRQSHLTTEYYPQLVVNNIGNVSTRFLGNKRKCQMSKVSLSAIRHLFFTRSRYSI